MLFVFPPFKLQRFDPSANLTRLFRCRSGDGCWLFPLALLIQDIPEIGCAQCPDNEDVAYDEANNTLGQVEDALEEANDSIHRTLEEMEYGSENAFDDLHDRGKQIADAFSNVRHVG